MLILLDGLDEVPSDRLSEMTTQIRNLVDRYSDNRFIVSCRIAAYRNFDNFRRFTDVAIADFDDEQIKTFISKWFESHSQPEWGQQCWKKLNSGDHKATKELTKTPLLLTLICILFKKRGEFPNKRATVYNEALWTLLSEWDASKEIIRQQPYKGIDTKCKEIMLAEIAYDNFVVDNLFFQQGEITQKIEQILREMLPDEKFIDGRDVLRAIEEQHGVLVSRADDIYSFSHLTLQEFLTAKHIVDNGIDIKELVANYLGDHRLREVFLILAGLRRADDLLMTMEKKIYSLVDTPKLQSLLIWVERVTDKTLGDIQYVGKRAIALAKAYAFAKASINVDNYEALFESRNAVEVSPNAKAIANIYTKIDNIFTHRNTYTKVDALAEAYAETCYYAKVCVDHQSFRNAYRVDNKVIYEDPSSVVYDQRKYNSIEGYATERNNQIHRSFEKFIAYTQWSKQFQIYRSINYSELIETLGKLKLQIPRKYNPNEVCRTFGQKIIQTWLTAFHLTPEMLDLSELELEQLDNYFYANLLMVECKKAAVRVSRETWEGIESRMLLPSTS